MFQTAPASRDAVSAALNGSSGCHTPVGPLAVHCCARFAGVTLRDYTLNAATLADCVVRYYERFRPDAVWVSADTWVTAEAMGARVAFPGADLPLGGAGDPLVRSPGDIDRIPPPDPGSRGRQPLMLEALGRVRAAIGNDAFIVACFDQYPFSLACALMGIQPVMTKIIEDPGFVEALMERGLEHGLAYARALADAGADMLSGGDSPAGLIGPALYAQCALPFEQRLIAGVRASCTIPVSLHICGNAMPILDGMVASGAPVLELDHLTDLGQACDAAGPEIALWGNLDPTGVLAHGSPDAVRQAAWDALETVRRRGHRRFVLSSGCTLAPDTPPENLDALRQAAREFDEENNAP